MLEVRELRVAYGKIEAVRGLHLAAEPGSITLVLGANGAGKTTTLRAIAGLHKPIAGEVLLEGRAVTGLPAHKIARAGIALVPEGRRVFAPLTVMENLRMGGYTASRSVGKNVEAVFALFPVLQERRDAVSGLLSGGEQQMLAFGRALMASPRVMLLDEPSMGLSPTMVEAVLERVRAIADSGIAVLMVEQNAEAGLDVADEVAVVVRGEVVHRGPAAQARSSSAVVHALLGETALAPPPHAT